MFLSRPSRNVLDNMDTRIRDPAVRAYCAVPQNANLQQMLPPSPIPIRVPEAMYSNGVVQVVPDSREHSLMCVHQSTSKGCSPSCWYIRTKSGKRGLTQPSNLTAKQILLGKSKCLITWVAQE